MNAFWPLFTLTCKLSICINWSLNVKAGKSLSIYKFTNMKLKFSYLYGCTVQRWYHSWHTKTFLPTNFCIINFIDYRWETNPMMASRNHLIIHMFHCLKSCGSVNPLSSATSLTEILEQLQNLRTLPFSSSKKDYHHACRFHLKIPQLFKTMPFSSH